MNRNHITLVAMTILLVSAVSLTGCAQLKSQMVLSSQQRSNPQEARSLRELSASEANELAKTLTGEIQTVYPSDAGLARVYGQVANLGDTAYAQVRFNIVTRTGNSQSEGETMKVVGKFTIAKGLAPGDIEPFDVQTSAPMGDVENLVVIVGAVR